MGSPEPKTWRERVRETAYFLVVVGLMAIPVVPFLRFVEDLPTGSYWLAMGAAAATTALAFVGWAHFHRAPVFGRGHRNRPTLALVLFLLFDAGVIACLLGLIFRGLNATGL